MSYNIQIVQIWTQLCKKESHAALELLRTYNQAHKIYLAFLELCSCLWVNRKQRDSIFCLVILRHVINLLLFTGYTNAPVRVSCAPLRKVTNKQNGSAV